MGKDVRPFSKLMKKVVVIGCGGSGKSTLAIKLGKATGLPVYHLDRIFWQPSWESLPKDIWREKQKELVSREEWIVDGNYGSTLEIRLQASDTIIYLDMPRWLCLYGALKRFFQYRGKVRPDMTEGCKERITWEFFSWIWNYRKTKRPETLAMLETLKEEKKVLILRSRKEVDAFLRDHPTSKVSR